MNEIWRPNRFQRRMLDELQRQGMFPPIPRHMSLVPWVPPPPSPSVLEFLQRISEEITTALGLPLEAVRDVDSSSAGALRVLYGHHSRSVAPAIHSP